jgi:hypothetical protein
MPTPSATASPEGKTMARYTPPVQSKAGQIFDIAFVVVAIFVALWLPLRLGLAGAAKAIDKLDAATWQTLGQNETMAAIWEKLGYTPETAHDIIRNRFHYIIDWPTLIIMALVLVGYFVFLFRASDKEYRDVIDEKFNNK